MPLWGIGESRDKDLVSGDGVGGTITRASAGAAHNEAPTWLENRDQGRDRQTEMTIGDNFTTTPTSGPDADGDGVGDEDPIGTGKILEQDTDAYDRLNQTVTRGVTGLNTRNRLTDGSRGSGFHYEYEYIDCNGNHRRRFECIVATSTNLASSIGAGISSVDWTQSIPQE